MWSTRKFAEDVLWTCKTYDVPIKKALRVMKPHRCPLVMINDIAFVNLGLVMSSCYVTDAPHYEKMAELWRGNTMENKKRIKLLKQYLKKHKYI